MDYQVYNMGHNINASMSNNFRMISLSLDYNRIVILYLDNNKPSKWIQDYDHELIKKHIQKYIKRLNKLCIKK